MPPVSRIEVPSSVVVTPEDIQHLDGCIDHCHVECLVAHGKDIVERCKASHAAEHVGISFNGGKDSIVMMELVLEVLGAEYVSRAHLFVFDDADEFPEMKHFREAYIKAYFPAAVLITVPSSVGPIKEALRLLQSQYGLEAVLLGTRRDDPSGRYQTSAIEMTSPGWPQLMRYCPVFDFTYHAIWYFCGVHRLPVCSLYKQGYTSLGRVGQTRPNKFLAVTNGSSEGSRSTGYLYETAGMCPMDLNKDDQRPKYLPAWFLADESKERDGRLAPASPTVTQPIKVTSPL